MDDIYSLFTDDETMAKQKALAMAQALAGQRGMGQALSMHPLLAQVGRGLTQDAQQGQELMEKTAGQRLAAALQAKRDQSEDSYRKSQEQHQRTQESIQQQQLAQGRYTLSNPGYGQSYVVEGKTGKVTPIGEERVRPPPGGGSAEQKDWTALTNSVSTTRGRGNKAITDLQNRLYSSERVKAAATNPDGTPKDLSPQMLTELAAATASLISNGHPAESTIHALLPKGMGMKAADISEWLTNEPTGAGQQAFVKMMLDLADREEHVVGAQMRKAQVDQLPNFLHLRGKNKDRFDGILQGVGLDPDRLDEKGLYRVDDEGGGTGGAGIPQPKSQAEYDALPAGAQYLGKDGTTVKRKKK